MTGIVAVTGAIGALVSIVLLRLGTDSMAIRYLVATAGAYGFFIAALGHWMRTWDDRSLDDLDIGSWSGSSGDGKVIDANGGPPFHGGGGDFAGGGASGSFEPMPRPSSSAASSSLPTPSAQRAAPGGGGFTVDDFDPRALPTLLIAMALAMALASLYVVWIAPSLLAELLLDGVPSRTPLGHVRPGGRHWLRTALRRTALPFACTALFLSGSGLAMAARVPGARSIGDVVHHAKVQRLAPASGRAADAARSRDRRLRRRGA